MGFFNIFKKKPELIRELEKELNIKLSKKISSNNRVKLYSADKEGNICYINIYDLELNKVPSVFSNPKYLPELKRYLTNLDLSFNSITDISALKELKNLENICLNDNQITDISVLKELKNLHTIDIEENQIFDISALSELEKLEELLMSKNQISDISALKELKNLESLFINENKIKELPNWICDFSEMDIAWNDDADFNTISLYGNPIENVPIEVLEQGKEAIRKYFEEKIISDFQSLTK